jgi:ring-1,2-phenylacetyl-CoA epoxidase subunit PaaC
LGSGWAEVRPAGAALGRLVVSLADTKFFLGRRVADWSVGAPELESAVACAAVAQEELGHARVLYPLLADPPSDPPVGSLEREEDRTVRFCPQFLTRPWGTWPEAVVGLALVDTALTVALASATASAHEELARRATRIVEEERFHAVFAWGRLRALLAGGSARRTEALLVERLQEVLEWLGSATAGSDALKALGVLDADGLQLRERYLRRVQEELAPSPVRIGEGMGVG